MQRVAMRRAAETAPYFFPYSPERDKLLNRVSPGNTTYGENIAAGYSTADGTTDQWMNSPGHRANMLDGSYTCVGIGCAHVGAVTYWVQCFGNRSTSESFDGSDVDSSEYTYYVNVDYDTVPFEGSGFNLNMLQSDPEPLYADDTYELQVGILNSAMNSIYCPTSAMGYS